MNAYLRCALCAATLTFIALPSSLASAQDPTTKPTVDSTVLTARLPAPKPAARQGADGRITVTWAAVEGAVQYRLWRSVPPAGTVAITLPNPQQPGYTDSDVRAGSTYYYLVAAVNEAGIEGLRAGTTPVTATISAGSTLPSPSGPQTVAARLVQPNPPSFSIAFSPVNGATAYHVQRVIFRPLATDPTRPDPATAQVSGLADVPAPATVATDTVTSATYPRFVQYRITPAALGSTIGPTSMSAYLTVPDGTSTTGGTTSTTGGTTTTGTSAVAAPAGSTTLTVAVAARLAVGGSASLAAIAGTTGARWLSVDESIATVDTRGTVTGRTAGSTQIVALASSSDGSLRLVTIPVTVTP